MMLRLLSNETTVAAAPEWPLAELVQRLDNLLTRSFLGLTAEEAALVEDARRLLDRLRSLDSHPAPAWRPRSAPAPAPSTRG